MVAQGEDAPRPPFAPDMLADLHGDVLPTAEAERLRAAIADDPEAGRVLAALDRVRDELGALRTDPAPAPPAPPEVMHRIRGAIGVPEGAERHPAPVADLSAGRPRRWLVAAAAAAAAVVVAAGGLTFASLRGDNAAPSDGSVLAQSTEPEPVVELGNELQPAAALSMLGRTEPGALADPVRRADCLRANGISATVQILGASAVTLRGSAGTLLLIPGPRPPQITAIVVGTSCSATDPATLARADIGN